MFRLLVEGMLEHGQQARDFGKVAALRAVGLLVSQAFARVAGVQAQDRAAGDLAAVNSLLRDLAQAQTVDEAIRTALETIRREFDWHYGSWWALDAASAEVAG